MDALNDKKTMAVEKPTETMSKICKTWPIKPPKYTDVYELNECTVI